MMLTEDTFSELYNPIQNHIDTNAGFNGELFETFGPELEFVLSFVNCFNKQKRVWTVVEGDEGMYCVAGYHIVNRMGYFITEKSWETGQEEFMYEEMGDDETLT